MVSRLQINLESVWMVVQEQAGEGPCDPGDVTIEEFGEDNSPPRSTVFVADYSGSMGGTIGLVEDDIPLAIDELRFEGARRDVWGLTKFESRLSMTLPVTIPISTPPR